MDIQGYDDIVAKTEKIQPVLLFLERISFCLSGFFE
jgi:hypothetical protein